MIRFFHILLMLQVLSSAPTSLAASNSIGLTGVVQQVVVSSNYGPRMYLDLNNDQMHDVWFNCPKWAIRAFPKGSIVDVVGIVASAGHPVALTDISVVASKNPTTISDINGINVINLRK